MYYVEAKLNYRDIQENRELHAQIMKYLHLKFVSAKNLNGRNPFAVSYPRMDVQSKTFGDIVRILSNEKQPLENFIDLKTLEKICHLDTKRNISIMDIARLVPVKRAKKVLYHKEAGLNPYHLLRKFCEQNGWIDQNGLINTSLIEQHIEEFNQKKEELFQRKERNPYIFMKSDSKQKFYKLIVEKTITDISCLEMGDDFSTYGFGEFGCEHDNNKRMNYIPEW